MLKNVTHEMSGNQYRCRIHQGSSMLYTTAATLTVNKAPSETNLTVKTATGGLSSGGTVKADTTVIENGTEKVSVWIPVTLAKDGKTYTKMAASENVDDKENYTYGAPYFWMDENGKLYNYTSDTAVGAAYTVTDKRVFDNDGTEITADAELTTGLN